MAGVRTEEVFTMPMPPFEALPPLEGNPPCTPRRASNQQGHITAPGQLTRDAHSACSPKQRRSSGTAAVDYSAFMYSPRSRRPSNSSTVSCCSSNNMAPARKPAPHGLHALPHDAAGRAQPMHGSGSLQARLSMRSSGEFHHLAQQAAAGTAKANSKTARAYAYWQQVVAAGNLSPRTPAASRAASVRGRASCDITPAPSFGHSQPRSLEAAVLGRSGRLTHHDMGTGTHGADAPPALRAHASMPGMPAALVPAALPDTASPASWWAAGLLMGCGFKSKLARSLHLPALPVREATVQQEHAGGVPDAQVATVPPLYIAPAAAAPLDAAVTSPDPLLLDAKMQAWLDSLPEVNMVPSQQQRQGDREGGTASLPQVDLERMAGPKAAGHAAALEHLLRPPWGGSDSAHAAPLKSASLDMERAHRLHHGQPLLPQRTQTITKAAAPLHADAANQPSVEPNASVTRFLSSLLPAWEVDAAVVAGGGCGQRSTMVDMDTVLPLAGQEPQGTSLLASSGRSSRVSAADICLTTGDVLPTPIDAGAAAALSAIGDDMLGSPRHGVYGAGAPVERDLLDGVPAATFDVAAGQQLDSSTSRAVANASGDILCINASQGMLPMDAEVRVTQLEQELQQLRQHVERSNGMPSSNSKAEAGLQVALSILGEPETVPSHEAPDGSIAVLQQRVQQLEQLVSELHAAARSPNAAPAPTAAAPDAHAGALYNAAVAAVQTEAVSVITDSVAAAAATREVGVEVGEEDPVARPPVLASSMEAAAATDAATSTSQLLADNCHDESDVEHAAGGHKQQLTTVPATAPDDAVAAGRACSPPGALPTGEQSASMLLQQFVEDEMAAAHHVGRINKQETNKAKTAAPVGDAAACDGLLSLWANMWSMGGSNSHGKGCKA